MHIGAMTFLHNDNYGSILQAWALQRTIQELGFEMEYLDYAPSRLEKIRNLLLSGNSPRLILEGMQKRSAAGKMHGGFDEFRRKNIRTSAPCRNRRELRERAGDYELLLSGSDQIWSPVWLNPVYFFDFAKGRKAAYAPSLGVKEMPEQRKRRKMAALLKDFSAISVREAEGAALLKALTGREVPVMPDPVMLASRERWMALVGDALPPEKKYILCYFIGDAPSYWTRVQEIAAGSGCEVRVIPRTEGARRSGYALEETVPPERWLALIAGAEQVVTDSFHGACFSAILNKSCHILRRYQENDPESKNSRIDQLLRSLNVESLVEPDWCAINESLAQQQEKGKKWLLDIISQAAN